MKWFKHYSNMRHDFFIKELINEFGLEGKAIWDIVLEIYSEASNSDNCGNDIEFNFEVFRKEIGISGKKMEKFFHFSEKRGKIFIKKHSNVIYIQIPKMRELMDEYTAKQKQKIPNVSGHNQEYIPPKKKEEKKKDIERSTTTSLIHIEAAAESENGNEIRSELQSQPKGIYFTANVFGECFGEDEWLYRCFKSQFIKQGKNIGVATTLKDLVSLHPGLMSQVQRWSIIPMARRMAAFTVVNRDKNPDDPFRYALKAAEEAWDVVTRYESAFDDGIKKNDYEVMIE